MRRIRLVEEGPPHRGGSASSRVRLIEEGPPPLKHRLKSPHPLLDPNAEEEREEEVWMASRWQVEAWETERVRREGCHRRTGVLRRVPRAEETAPRVR